MKSYVWKNGESFPNRYPGVIPSYIKFKNMQDFTITKITLNTYDDNFDIANMAPE